MGAQDSELKGPDLAAGVSLADIPDGGSLLGHAAGEAVLVVKQGAELFAVGATCTHYGGPLAEGIITGDTVRCPWHHACFNLRTGEAARAPAMNPIACYRVESDGERVRVGEKLVVPERAPVAATPATVLIVGAGAAGHAAAEMLRRQGHGGRILLVGADADPPVDRPNLSKDYLAGNAPEEWIPLRPPEHYAEHKIELRVGTRVTALDVAARTATLDDGSTVEWDALLLAPGARPIRLAIPGADLPHVSTLRTLADSRAIIARIPAARRAVVIGASFIGLEVAASLRTRGLEVHVVAPEARPLERVLGAALGDFVRAVHEDKGVVFHLGQTATAITAAGVTLEDGSELPADLVVIGVGVRPEVELAQAAGLAVENGILVDEYLATSAPGVWAAGDAARFIDPTSGARLRIEHWVVAQRQGQAAAQNILGKKVRYHDVPFFWSAHYDVTIAYVGHADLRTATVAVEGDLAARDAKVSYTQDGRVVAVATVSRDRDSLAAEVELERRIP